MSNRKRIITGVFFLLVMACALYGLWPRMRLERRNNNVAILSDYREIATLARNSGLDVDEAISVLKEKGLTGIMVSELNGDTITHNIGPAEIKPDGTKGTIISILPGSPHEEMLNEWLRLRFAVSGDGPVVLSTPPNMLRSSGIIPDIEGLEAAKRASLPIFYRPAPSPGHLSERASVMLREVNAKYPVSVFTPSGEYVSGYPDVSVMADTARELDIPLAVVEFSRQLGEKELNAKVLPMLIPLHSVTNDEMTSRRITRAALRDRLIRAALERSIRLLLLRTAPANTSNFKFSDFANEMGLLRDALAARGFSVSWPETVFADARLHTSIFTAWALSAVLLFAAWRYLSRMGLKFGTKGIITLGAVSVILAGLVWKVAIIARLAGALAAPLLAVEAALLSMEAGGHDRCVFRGFVFAVIGGLALASFFSVARYMLRLQTFSGVKLTLVLPPVMVLIHDLKKRIHPESLIEFLSRPPLWGELILYAVLLAGVGVIVFRSDNVDFIPGFETRIREALERLLVARPRTREFLIGYPCVMLVNYFVRNNLIARYRELFRIGAVVGFSSVVNSFCHFHTPLSVIMLREFNGLWTGLLLGFIVVIMVKFLLRPLLRFIRPLIS